MSATTTLVTLQPSAALLAHAIRNGWLVYCPICRGREIPAAEYHDGCKQCRRSILERRP